MAPLVEDPLHDQSRAAEITISIFTNPDNFCGDIPGLELVSQILLAEELIEPNRDDIRADLFDRPEHIGLIPENRMVYRF